MKFQITMQVEPRQPGCSPGRAPTRVSPACGSTEGGRVTEIDKVVGLGVANKCMGHALFHTEFNFVDPPVVHCGKKCRNAADAD